MSTVYVLMNPEGRPYIGHTNDLATRLDQHTSGDSRWTSTRGPWKLVLQEEYPTRSEAMRRERALKSGRMNQHLRDKLNAAAMVERVLPRKD